MNESDRPQSTPSEPYTPGVGTWQDRRTLTDAEREALEIAIEYVGSAYAVEHHAQTIARLIERLG